MFLERSFCLSYEKRDFGGPLKVGMLVASGIQGKELELPLSALILKGSVFCPNKGSFSRRPIFPPSMGV